MADENEDEKPVTASPSDDSVNATVLQDDEDPQSSNPDELDSHRTG